MNISDALKQQVQNWAAARTHINSKRYDDLIRDKMNILIGDETDVSAPGFFTYIGKPPHQIETADVEAWRDLLQARGLAASTVYTRVSRVSSFFEWVMGQPGGEHLLNPAKQARPPAPKAYGTSQTRPLNPHDIDQLLAIVREQANRDNKRAISAKRDLVLLQLYFMTGKKRSEIISLRWRDFQLNNEGVFLQTDTPPLNVTAIRATLIAYLKASDRWNFETGAPNIAPNAPMWLRHDRAAKGAEAVTSHGFVYMLKKYAKMAGLQGIQLNQVRHTAAQRISAGAATLEEIQRQLGHASSSMTRAYLRQLQEKQTNAADD